MTKLTDCFHLVASMCPSAWEPGRGDRCLSIERCARVMKAICHTLLAKLSYILLSGKEIETVNSERTANETNSSCRTHICFYAWWINTYWCDHQEIWDSGNSERTWKHWSQSPTCDSSSIKRFVAGSCCFSHNSDRINGPCFLWQLLSWAWVMKP